MHATAFAWTTPVASSDRIDWKSDRDRIDLAQVVTSLLGPAPGRRGERGRRLWWPCPFHEDKNPSFAVDPGKPFWRCYGCNEHGDAANLLMRLERLSFPEAIRKLTSQPASTARKAAKPAALRPSPPPPPKPSGLDRDAAEKLVDTSAALLWSVEGKAALAYLEGRGLTPETIRNARLGFVPSVQIPKADGSGAFKAAGIVIPWIGQGGRLAAVKIRQPPNMTPKYVLAFHDPAAAPEVYPGLDGIKAGKPVVIVEGELDALLVGQELAGWQAAVITLGSASARPSIALLGRLLPAALWILAVDGDEAGDRSAASWPASAIRIRPPLKDWTDAHKRWPNLIRYAFGRHFPQPPITFADPTELHGEGDEGDAYTSEERLAIQDENCDGSGYDGAESEDRTAGNGPTL